MDLTKCKITGYETGVRSLPDYPSDGGYTATELKAVFDARSDGEIMKQHNKLVDDLITKFGQVEVDIADEVEAHQQSEGAHQDLFSTIHERIAEIIGDNISIHIALDEKASSERMDTAETDINIIYGQMNDKVDRVEGKGLSTYDFNDEWKQSIQNSFDEAIYAQTAIDNHIMNEENPHNVTAEQVGAYTKDETDNALQQLDQTISMWATGQFALFTDLLNYYTKDETDNLFGEYIPPLENDINALDEKVGDIGAALDAIIAIQQSYIGG